MEKEPVVENQSQKEKKNYENPPLKFSKVR